MLRILYISTSRTPLANAELDGILVASRRNNALVGVTGCLVAGGRRFLQVLEGPEEAVQTVYARIARDPRHFAIVRLATQQADERLFGHWAMAFERAGPVGVGAQPLPRIVERLTAGVADPTVRVYFDQFATLHAAAA